MGPLAVIAAYGVIFLAGELATRRLRISPYLTRIGIHIVSGVAVVWFALWLTRAELIGLAVLFTLALAISKRFSILRSIHQVQRSTWGELFFPPGIGLAATLYLPEQPHWYALAVLIMALSDPLANLVGARVGSRKLLFGKSVAGSMVFFMSSFALGVCFLSPALALRVAALATLIEACSPFGSDNLTIIPAVALAHALP